MDYRKHGNGCQKGTTGPMHGDAADGRIMNAESVNGIDATLNEISRELKPGETLILDIGNNYFEQVDEIYDTLVLRGYNVRKASRNGRNQIIVSRGDQRGGWRH
jgi:predicted acyl esterase